jgi:FkbH-like protein
MADLPWLRESPAGFLPRCKQLGPHSDAPGREIERLASYRIDARQSIALARAIARCLGAGCDLAPLSRFKLGVLSSGTFDLVIDCLPAACARHGVALAVVAAPYDQVAQPALDPGSQINIAHVDACLIAVDHHWLALDTTDLTQPPEDRISSAIVRLRSVVEGLRRHGHAPAILQTVPAPPESVFGSYDRLVRGSVRALIGECNRAIVALAEETGSYLLDVATLAERVGTDRWFDPIQWVSYKFPFSADCCPIYADTVGRLAGAIRGKTRKCLVLDLDNTIWGGVIGDDGIEGIVLGQGSPKGEAFLAVQRIAHELRGRGILLAVCSKNDDAVARGPFREHAEMLLREEHISVFQANWTDKASNLESIAKNLNIGLDALVFFDDNPAERAQVRAALPMVAVPELPEDPSWYAWIIGAAGYFEAVGFSAEDRLRADAMAADAHRAEVMATTRDLGDYLSALEMVITFEPFDAKGRKRITQLINKTNQFNLTTRRYTEAKVAEMEADYSVFTLQVRLKDKFGDLGMIGVVIARTRAAIESIWELDTWLMSCRVLGRCVEQAMIAKIVSTARERGIDRIVGHYIPTAKNGMVAEHYRKLGFELVHSDADGKTIWELSVRNFVSTELPMTVLDAGSDGANDASAGKSERIRLAVE